MIEGFFPSNLWQMQRQPLSLVSDCEACGLYKGCITPKMPVSGKGQKKILIVAEAPGENEDERGIQLCGNAGQELIRMINNIGFSMRRDCWLTNTLICRPPRNRKPSDKEIMLCRPNLSKSLKGLQPDVIIPMGEAAFKSVIGLAWKDGEVDNAGTWTGWQIPSMKLNAWICPTYHPSFYLRGKAPVVDLIMTKHLRAAFSLSGKPYPNGLPDYEKKVEVEMNAEKAARLLSLMIFGRGNKPFAFDYETTTLKPDGPYAEILCCAVSDGEHSLAFPWQGLVVEVMKRFLTSRIPKIAANMDFENRWSRKLLGVVIQDRDWLWDICLGAHWRNCHHGVTSLKFQAFVLFGIPDYDSHIEPYKKSDGKYGKNSPNRLKEVDRKSLLTYCGLDSLFEAMAAKKQMEAYK